MILQASHSNTTGLLLSGGLDSAILLGHLLRQGRRVQPFYVSTGCCWESAERHAVREFLTAIDSKGVEPVVELAMPLTDLYGKHWSITGSDVPDQSTKDNAVALLGRNPLLLLKPMLWCGQQGIQDLAIATLSNNPFGDATPRFFEQFAETLTTATEAEVTVRRPFAKMTKVQVLQLAEDLPLHLTFSCLSPQNGLHCGACNKCEERAGAMKAIIHAKRGERKNAMAAKNLT